MEANLSHPPALIDTLADCYQALLAHRRARLAKTNADPVQALVSDTESALSDAPSKENVSKGIVLQR